MHELQRFAVPSVEEKIKNPSKSDTTVYVGVGPHSSRTDETDKNEKENKKGSDEKGAETPVRVNKTKRKMADGLLLVVPTQIYGQTVKALIDSGATRCFVTPSCVARCGLKGMPQDVFLELGVGGRVPGERPSRCPPAAAGWHDLLSALQSLRRIFLYLQGSSTGLEHTNNKAPGYRRGERHRMRVTHKVPTRSTAPDWRERN